MPTRLFPAFICFFLLTNLFTYGQQTIKGRILNGRTGDSISYANIGFKKSNVGTISNPDGSFSLYIPENLLRDTLSISSIGFGNRNIAIRYLLQKPNPVIYLTEKIVLLKPVIVSTRKVKANFFELGNPHSRGGVLEADTLYAGRSLALLIETNESDIKKGRRFPAFIEKARLRIFRNNLKSFKFRIRLNSVDRLTGQPGGDLLNESIVIESTMKNGWLEFNLSDLNVEVYNPFYITFEQILDLADRTAIANDYRAFLTKHPERLKVDSVELDGKKVVRERIVGGGGIDLAGTFIGIASSKKAAEQYTCYVRETSFGEWKKVWGIVTATVTLSNQPGNTDSRNDEKECNGDSAVCKADKYARDFMNENGINGMQIFVSKKNRTLWSVALGYADMEKEVSVTDSTKFRINSISKSMTSIAVIKLVSESKLNLDSPIHSYIPDFPKKRYSITTRQLAGHLAGFRDYSESNINDYIRWDHYDNSTQALKVFENDTLLFKPGTQFSYSTFGWNLIGAIVEKLSGENYLDFMSKNIWRPLKLQNTCGDNNKQHISNRSKYYDVAGQEIDLGDISYKYPGGGLLSTGEDLVKLGNELLYGSYIIPKFKKLLFQSLHTLDNKETGYGLGWYIGTDRNGHTIWYHAGDSFGGSSYIIIYPDDEIVISFLANSQAGTMFDIEKIGELFYK